MEIRQHVDLMGSIFSLTNTINSTNQTLGFLVQQMASMVLILKQ